MASSQIVAQAHFIFGVRPGVANNISYIDEQTVVFPAGNHCVRYNLDEETQRFIPGMEKSQGMQALAISPNRRYLAVSERAEKGTISIYDLQNEQNKKRKTLSGGEVAVQTFVCMAFSHDSKYLIGQSGAPDWTLFYWVWQKQKHLATLITGGATNPVYQVSFNPQDNTQICVSGNGVFKLIRYAEGTLKQFNSVKQEVGNFLSHDWLSEKRVIAGTETGRLLVFDSGELRWEMNVITKTSTHEPERPAEKKQEEAAPSQLPRVIAIKNYSKGFVCSVGQGMVFLFEKMEDKDGYKKCSEIRIPQDPYSNDPSQAEQQEVVTLCFSPSEESLTSCTDRGQLYSIPLSSAEIGKPGHQAQFDFLTESFHSDAITGLSICYRKPIVATCSVDRSVRIWNFETNELELHKEFQEQAFSVALHPTGLFVLVGFCDKLRLLNLLIDDIRTFMEFTVRGCRECAFSNGGHLFAAVNGTVIHIYCTTTLENVRNLKGHNGKVRSIMWSDDDSRLVSCGMDGAVYEWNTLTSKRESECVLKTCMYTSIAISPDAKIIFAVGTDSTLKEIQDHHILKDVPANDTTYTAVAFSHSGRMLFTGTSSGTIRVMKYPLPLHKDWTEYQGHAASITKMLVTFDDQFLLTVSEDGCLLFWKIIDKERHGLKREKEIYYSEEILITKIDLENKNQNMLELKTRVEELKLENQFQLRLKGMDHEKEVHDITDKFMQDIESLQTKYQVLKVEKERMELDHRESMERVVEMNTKEKLDHESTSLQNLMLEYERYQELQHKSQGMQEEYEGQLQSMEESKSLALEEHTQRYESQLKEKLLKLKECQDRSQQQRSEYEEMIRQMEKDADREILEIRFKYERLLKEKTDANLQLKDETGIMRKKFSSLQREISDKTMEADKLKLELQKLQAVIKSLEKDILGLKREIQERDKNIMEKEKCNYDMRKKNSDLEKFKFVLDYKINELKKQIESKENSIIEMRDQIHKMEEELGQFKRKNSQLELNITELKMNLKVTDEDKRKEMQRVRSLQALEQRFKTDVHRCVEFIQEPKKLKDSIRELYRTYVQSSMVNMGGGDSDIMTEYNRKQEHFEMTMANFKKRMAKDKEIHRADKFRIITENTLLINENQDLIHELHHFRSHAPLTVQLSPPKSAPATPVTAFSSDGESERIIQRQSMEIERLRQEILIRGDTHLVKSPGSPKLPPLLS
ncbi:hypothetical protein AAFF_G00320970 [Aldrovandia affinis]|uniref:EML-like second beta-propeller domain-containing protein n=1 Tax=Aldrovandia affinis TaxID=143900 RepID=A0AAD7W0Q3_9TELE|nr:hypothetical protein AAFF_G00320970 [Aldrovandia affinis]